MTNGELETRRDSASWRLFRRLSLIVVFIFAVGRWTMACAADSFGVAAVAAASSSSHAPRRDLRHRRRVPLPDRYSDGVHCTEWSIAVCRNRRGSCDRGGSLAVLCALLSRGVSQREADDLWVVAPVHSVWCDVFVQVWYLNLNVSIYYGMQCLKYIP